MSLSPMLELVIAGTVVGTLALAALEECLFGADLAAWRRATDQFISHSITTVISTAQHTVQAIVV